MLSFGRRVRFTVVVLTAQVLLMATSIAWCVHMVLIAMYGGIYFVESNRPVLYAEIAITVVITLFAAIVFALQWKRLGETRRANDYAQTDKIKRRKT